jgi:hypothetical protein
MQTNEKHRVNQGMSPVRRWSGLYTVGLMILLLVFFAYHQWKRTGFFTSAFGPAEMVALYLPILVSLIAPIVRAIQGRNDTARLVDVVSDVCLAVGSLWLWITFPFDFAHLADVFPPAIQLALARFNNTIGRIILLLQIVISFISALSSAVSYVRDRDENLTHTAQGH